MVGNSARTDEMVIRGARERGWLDEEAKEGNEKDGECECTKG